MHVLLVSQQWSRLLSGVGTFTRLLSRGLGAAGVRVSVLAPEEGGRLPADLAAIPVRRLPVRLQGGHERWLRAAWAWRGALADSAVDVVHFTDARESLLSAPSGPWLGTVHDSYAADCPAWPWQLHGYPDAGRRWAYYRLTRALEARAYRRAPALVANSAYTARALDRAYGLAALPVIRNAVEAPPAQHAVDAGAGSVRPFRIAFSGGNPARKGLPLLRRAAGLLAERFPVELWTFGFGAPGEEVAGPLRVRHFGLLPRAEAWRRLATADLLALPSRVEALGLVVMEAMACGLPVVASAIGGGPELIRPGRDGLLIDPGSLAGLTAALAGLLRDPARRARLAASAALRARSFSLARLAQGYRAIYAELLGQGAGKE